MGKRHEQIFYQRVYMDNKYTNGKMFSVLAIRKNYLQTTVRYHSIPTERLKFKRGKKISDNTE